MSCGITSGISLDCSSINRVGGVNKRLWIANLNDFEDDKYTFTSGYVSAINLTTPAVTYEFTSRKKSHSGGCTYVKQGTGGNSFYQHDVIIKLFPDTPTDDDVIVSLGGGNFVIILEDNNQNFFLYGHNNGMEQTEGGNNTGQEFASDVADSLTFVGEETSKPLRISVGGTGDDYASTLTYLEGLTS